MPKQKDIRFLQGNETIAEGALSAGAGFFAGYPITPSSEIAEIASRRLPECGGVFLQMEDELGSIGAVIGAAMAGKKAFTATSGPGFSLMQENLGVAIMAEVPCVLVNVMRSGPSTGLATKPAQMDVLQARWGTHGDHAIIALCPASVQECFDLTVQAFNFAEEYRNPVILLADEVVGHMREKVIIRSRDELTLKERKLPTGDPRDFLPYRPDADGVPPFAVFGGKYIQHANGSMHDETGFPNTTPRNADSLIRRLSDKIYRNRDRIVMTKETATEDAEIVIVVYGSTTRSAQEAVHLARAAGRRVGMIQLITLWPFPDAEVAALCAKAEAVIVPEMNLGQIVGEVRRVNPGTTPVHGLSRVDSESITPGEILALVEEVAK